MFLPFTIYGQPRNRASCRQNRLLDQRPCYLFFSSQTAKIIPTREVDIGSSGLYNKNGSQCIQMRQPALGEPTASRTGRPWFTLLFTLPRDAYLSAQNNTAKQFTRYLPQNPTLDDKTILHLLKNSCLHLRVLLLIPRRIYNSCPIFTNSRLPIYLYDK